MFLKTCSLHREMASSEPLSELTDKRQSIVNMQQFDISAGRHYIYIYICLYLSIYIDRYIYTRALNRVQLFSLNINTALQNTTYPIVHLIECTIGNFPFNFICP